MRPTEDAERFYKRRNNVRIKITADSTCDLSEELLAQWDIALMPMHILMGEDSYLDGVTIYPADVFAYVNAGGKMPKSAAANLVEYTEFFEPFAKECDAVIHISVSSKLSSCFQNARLAAGEFENVCVVDSQNICTGQGYLVLQAAKWAADGLLPNIVVLDPPRKGCDEPTLKAVLAMAPQRIVMVSCNPATAARDLKYLSQHGYAVQAVQPVDMFPRTKHVECAALLCREKF